MSKLKIIKLKEDYGDLKAGVIQEVNRIVARRKVGSGRWEYVDGKK